MKNKLFDVLGKFNIKNVSGFTKRNLLMVLFALFFCMGVGMSAYLGSNVTGGDNAWSVSITYSPSTPTPTLGPDTGWWSAIATPTPRK